MKKMGYGVVGAGQHGLVHARGAKTASVAVFTAAYASAREGRPVEMALR